ncbi:MAG: TerC family protein [Luteolibacter sp.]|uniref:TerC family protein n=1 Tax=Luteolibacter sp. TaxID=1962973 RepID=UPI003264430E
MILASLFEFNWLAEPQAWGALLTLTLLEIVLGIDNIVFISILVDKLPEEKRKSGRTLGLGLAMITRLMLLATITWIMGLTKVLFSIPIPEFLRQSEDAISQSASIDMTGKGLILLVGGIFLIWKATKEIHHKLEDDDDDTAHVKKGASFIGVLIQIAVIDIVFSLDSVITAVGMAKHLSVMMLAVVISVGIMMLAAGAISSFVSKHPSIKMLALSFLILIGTALIAEALHVHIPKGYIYFSMAFSLAVEMLNLKLRKKTSPPPAAEI